MGINVRDKKSKDFIIYTPDCVKDSPNLKIFAIYPTNWGETIELHSSFRDASGRTIKYKTRHNWGEVPCLGYVKEESEYWACYAALTAGIMPLNDTFSPRAIEIKTKFPDNNQHAIRRKPYVKSKRIFGK